MVYVAKLKLEDVYIKVRLISSSRHMNIMTAETVLTSIYPMHFPVNKEAIQGSSSAGFIKWQLGSRRKHEEFTRLYNTDKQSVIIVDTNLLHIRISELHDRVWLCVRNNVAVDMSVDKVYADR